MYKSFIFFLFFFSIFIHSQEKLKVNYEVIHQTNVSWGDAKLSDEMKDQMLKKIEQLKKRPESCILYYYGGNSYFTELVSDEKNINKKQKKEYFKFKNQNSYYQLNDYRVEEFYGYYPDSSSEIEYKDENLTIENYLCKLAIVKTGNIISKVWYTEEIPVSAGPYNFNSLPGLVLKVENSKYLCYATHISKDCKEHEIKKMDSKLSVYKGLELETKIKEGRDKMRKNGRENLDAFKQKMQNSK
ncbi:GLPGLI family protein [Chryseobacterium indologenes]|uniref:GLPGLI family protein n=1 Tax=Chryseobacterium indologenes TaxID=253 RepID=UPI004058A1ED